MFVASAAHREDGKFGVDVSHRGGQPGFLGLDAEDTIVVPDFRGNGFFQTIGNLLAFPRAGLLIPDFATGDLLASDRRCRDRLGRSARSPPIPAPRRLWKITPQSRPLATPRLSAAGSAKPNFRRGHGRWGVYGGFFFSDQTGLRATQR